MRWFHLAVIILFVAVILIFMVQNLDVVTVAFLGFSARAPLAVVIPIIYLLGAATGGSLIALLRRSYERSKRGVGAS
jgi:lipopolysaccharide assembly protein A